MQEIPNFSIIIPVYNQETIIHNNLISIDNTIEGTHEYLIILDCCTDNTRSRVMKWIEEDHSSSLTRIRIYETYIPVFEATCDNIGFKNAEGKYLLEIQADMVMTQKGFNTILIKPFLKMSNVIGVSGRCSHDMMITQGHGRINDLFTKPLDRSEYSDCIFYINETCNRGPLLLDASKVRELNYLDDINFPLDDSDHDLFARAWYFKKWICGYIPIDFDSPEKDGSTRKQRDEINTRMLEKRLSESNGGFLMSWLETSYIPRFSDGAILVNLD